MAENAKGTSLQELKDKVHSGLDLVSDEELAMLFEEAEKLTTSPNPAPASKQNPSNAPVNAEPTPPVGETSKGQAGLLDRVPVKFKGEDEAATLDKVLKALQDTETALTQSNQERSQLQGIVQELSKRPREEYRPPVQQTAVAVKTETVDETADIDDSTFFDKAVDSTRRIAREEARKIAREESARTIQHYDTFATRRDVLTRFKDSHSDFDNFRQEIVEVCRMHPEWDNDLNGLPKIYEAAKTLAIAKARAITAPTVAQPVVDRDALKAEIRSEVEAEERVKARQAIQEEVRKRKAASGLTSSRDANISSNRAGDERTTPLTAEDKVLDDMMKSGPRSLGI